MTTVTEPPPIPTTGDPLTDSELSSLRDASQDIAEAQARVILRSRERQRLVMSLRDRGVLYRVIADAVPTTEQTIYKIHRDAKEAQRQEAHAQGDHQFCTAANCEIAADRDKPTEEEQ